MEYIEHDDDDAPVDTVFEFLVGVAIGLVAIFILLWVSS